ncbi:TPA: glycosyltransferase family 2 protein [Pseudomonas aeruginosa]|nr:glycosyltransferase family 2 protein [Pseudomonas aeruginosa]
MNAVAPLIPCIVSGGSGTRLWPVSRESMPKPFMRLADDQSLLQKTFLRIAGLPDVARLLTVTNRDLLFRTLDDYRAVNRSGLAQDAIPASPDSFANLLDELYAEADIGVAYGRQLPHPGAGLLGAQARRFNYPPESRSKRLADASELGIKTCFSSDSFSAYRSDALAAVGGFPEDVIGSEDAYVAARLLQAGYAVRYAASAEVYHSHDYRLLEEFRRYFDIGVFYGRERWIRAAFGGAGGEGKRYVLAEIQALRAAGALYRVPEIALRSAFKLLGYRLGQLERHLPVALKRRISMFPGYWK